MKVGNAAFFNEKRFLLADPLSAELLPFLRIKSLTYK